MRRSLQPFLITLFLAAFPYVLLAVPDKRTVLYELALKLPYLFAAMIAFLSLKLNQRRPFFVAGLLAGSYALVDRAGVVPPGVVAIGLPLSLLLLFSLPDRMFARGHALASLALVLAPPTFLAFLAAAGGEPVSQFLFVAPSRLAAGVSVPALGLAAALLFAASTALAKDRFHRDFRLFTSFGLLPLYHVLDRVVAAGGANVRLESALGFLSCGTIVTYGVFRLYWAKVFLDELTGLPNRRALNDRLARLRGEYSIAMCDIDLFKRFNDNYGHEEGDNVLRFVAKHLSERTTGIGYRYGGEEICVIFEGTDARAASEEMEQARSELAARQFHIRSPKKVRAATSPKNRAPGGVATEVVQVTVSVGVAASGPDLDRPEDVLIAADAALYRAKAAGRNRVLMAEMGLKTAAR